MLYFGNPCLEERVYTYPPRILNLDLVVGQERAPKVSLAAKSSAKWEGLHQAMLIMHTTIHAPQVRTRALRKIKGRPRRHPHHANQVRATGTSST